MIRRGGVTDVPRFLARLEIKVFPKLKGSESQNQSHVTQINISLISVVHLRTLIYAQFGSDCVNH